MFERNCDTCKYFNGEILISKANAHCLKCMDFDEWESKEEREDLIHNPKHYTYSKYEPINVIKEWNLNFDLGNVVKYIARCEHKGNKLLDLKKASMYLEHEIKSLEDNPCN